MTELEKVIDDLGRVMACGQTMLDCGTESPMVFKMIRDAADNAIVFLKAQEPVKPTLDIRHGKSMWRCGSCSTALQPNQMHAKFCFNCGQKVKWDG